MNSCISVSLSIYIRIKLLIIQYKDICIYVDAKSMFFTKVS